MPGSMCSVAICKSNSIRAKNSGEWIRFFTFPKDEGIRNEWIRKCYRKDQVFPNTGKICSKHFTEEDFEDVVQAKLMNHPPRILKKTAIPSLHLHPGSPGGSPKKSKRAERYESKQNRFIVKTLTAEPEETASVEVVEPATNPEAHGKSKDRLELNASNNYSLQSNLETGSVLKNLKVYSSEQSNFSSYCDSEREPLVQEMPSTELPSSKYFPKNVRTPIAKVLGKQNFKDSKVQEILDKVRPKKKGSVFLLPLKKKCNENKLTKDKIKSIIRNLPEIYPNLKDGLLTSLSDKKYVPLKCLSPETKDTAKAKNHCKKRNLNHCSCSIHCVKKRLKKQRPIVLTPSLHIKIDGSDLGQNYSEDRQFQSAEKLFSVSTLLANIYDKEQIERLCQLVIESIFKLKNININGTMSKIEIYFFNNFKPHILQKSECGIATDSSEVPNNVGSTTTSTSHTAGSYNVGNDSDDQSHPLDREENEVIPNTRLLDKKSEKNQNNDQFSVSPPSRYSRDKQENITQNVKVDLNFYHDHSYISQDSRVLFEKPPYLVNLVNIDTFRSSFKKTRILKRPPPPMPKRVKREILKLRGQVSRLRGILEKKNENMEKAKEKLKYLGSIVCEYKGLKRIRFPKTKKKKDSEILLHKGQDSFKKDSIEIKLKEKKRKKMKLIPDLGIPSLNTKINKLTGCETSEVDCDEDLQFFYDSFLEGCIEEG